MKTFYTKNRTNIARIAMLIIQLALIRTLATCVYLLHTEQRLAQNELQMYLVGSLTAAVASMLLALLYFGQKYMWLTLFALLTVVVLIGIKIHYVGFRAG